MLVIFSVSQIVLTLLRLAQERLTSKQIRILLILRGKITPQPVTRLVAVLSQALNCSASAVWLNMNQLKRIQLVDYGSSSNKGKPIRLTKVGRWLSQQLKSRVDLKHKGLKNDS